MFSLRRPFDDLCVGELFRFPGGISVWRKIGAWSYVLYDPWQDLVLGRVQYMDSIWPADVMCYHMTGEPQLVA